jgi:hypothetical protein
LLSSIFDSSLGSPAASESNAIDAMIVMEWLGGGDLWRDSKIDAALANSDLLWNRPGTPVLRIEGDITSGSETREHSTR